MIQIAFIRSFWANSLLQVLESAINQVLHLTWDTTWESDKTLGKITHKRANRSAFFQAARKTQDCIIKTNAKHNNKKDLQKKHGHGIVIKNHWRANGTFERSL